MKKFIKPNFKKSNLNISATLAEYIGAPNKNATLPILEKELNKGYKNVVFICFDGLGIYPLKKNLDKNDFLLKNIKQKLRSTFPSTTTNATTSLMFNQLPLEHGWFGWSLYFENINRNVNIFLNTDSWTNEKVEITNSPIGELNYYFDNAKSDYEINTIFPGYVKVAHPERNNIFKSEADFFNHLKSICQKEGKQFIYAYYNEPDHSMHDYGVSSPKAKEIIESISKNMEELHKTTQNTLFIITADHGQVDITGHIELFKDEKLMSMLKIYPFMEGRAPAFLVKDGMHKEFEKHFKANYKKDYKLYKSADLVRKGYFGDFGNKAHLLGDYIAIGTYTHKQVCLTPSHNHFLGHHTSLTEEMEVPLIILKN